MNHPHQIIVGSRGSLLAQTQTRWIIKQLQKRYPQCNIKFKIINTLGDLDQITTLTDFKDWGVFVKELQKALIEKKIDLVVHSLKDVPEQNPKELVLTAFPPREQAHDLLITQGQSLAELPKNSVVGTSSPRRILQLTQLRSDLRFKTLRGNLPSRVKKLQGTEFQAILLAAAGVNRLNLTVPFAEALSLEQMVPAMGQGALALECRKDDENLQEALQFLNDPITEKCVLAERAFMKALGGGCQAPMAAYTEYKNQKYRMLCFLAQENHSNNHFFDQKHNDLSILSQKNHSKLSRLSSILTQKNIKNLFFLLLPYKLYIFQAEQIWSLYEKINFINFLYRFNLCNHCL